MQMSGFKRPLARDGSLAVWSAASEGPAAPREGLDDARQQLTSVPFSPAVDLAGDIREQDIGQGKWLLLRRAPWRLICVLVSVCAWRQRQRRCGEDERPTPVRGGFMHVINSRTRLVVEQRDRLSRFRWRLSRLDPRPQGGNIRSRAADHRWDASERANEPSFTTECRVPATASSCWESNEGHDKANQSAGLLAIYCLRRAVIVGSYYKKLQTGVNQRELTRAAH